jgi:hypothetical protein
MVYLDRWDYGDWRGVISYEEALEDCGLRIADCELKNWRIGELANWRIGECKEMVFAKNP